MIKIIDKEQYRNDIITLWSECFGDSKEYIEFFLDNCPSECMAFLREEKPLSILFLLDGNINSYKVKYIYAACTLKAHQGKGLMSQLIENAKLYCKRKGFDGIFLVPGQESLYSYYERFGFECVFEKKSAELCLDSSFFEIDSCEDIKLITQLRNELLSDIDSFKFNEKTTEYTVKEHFFNDGKVYYLNKNEQKCLAFCYIKNKTCIIKEFLCSENVEMLKIFKHFANSDVQNIYISYPIVYNNMDIMAKCTKCGMCCFLTDEFKEASVNKRFYAGIYLD